MDSSGGAEAPKAPPLNPPLQYNIFSFMSGREGMLIYFLYKWNLKKKMTSTGGDSRAGYYVREGRTASVFIPVRPKFDVFTRML